MLITVSNEIIIEDPHELVEKWAKRNLVIKNPEYEKKQQMGKWIGNTPRSLWMYKKVGNSLLVPVGVFKYLRMLIAKENIAVTYKTDVAKNELLDYGSNIQLYDYQRTAVDEMLDAGYGILKSPAGSGKTQMGIAMIADTGYRTLWLTHTHDLLAQSMQRASAYMDKSLFGTITDGKINIGKGITFATVQTLSKLDLKDYKYYWDMIIVDECHRCAGTPTTMTQFAKVLGSLAAPHKYGLSATVHRADGLIKTTYMLLGEVMYSVPDSAVEDKIMTARVERVNTHWDLPVTSLDTDGTLMYATMLSDMAVSNERNNIIRQHMLLEQDNYHLVLSDRRTQLLELYKDMPNAAIITGDTKAETREKVLEDMRNGKIHYLLATYKLAKEGLDIPRLDRLHLATPQKDYAIVVQAVGRVQRTFPGKEMPIVFDYVDEVVGFLEGYWNKRRAIYKKCRCIGG